MQRRPNRTILLPNEKTKRQLERQDVLINPVKRVRDGVANYEFEKKGKSPLTIEEKLRKWVSDKLDPGAQSAEVADRRAALAEVGMLLVSEEEKYPTSAEMKDEIGELVTQLGGEDMLDEYISFLLELRASANKSSPSPPPPFSEEVMDPQSSFDSSSVHAFAPPPPLPPLYGYDFSQPPPHHPFPFPFPHGQSSPPPPQFNPHHHHPPPPMSMMMPFPPPPGYMMGPPPPMPHHRMLPPPPRGNLVFSISGQPTQVQKLKEREIKRRELLQRLTDELRQLLEKAGNPENSAETRAKYLELVDSVKKKIATLTSPTSVAQSSSSSSLHTSLAAASSSQGGGDEGGKKGGIVGYYGNQYINPDSSTSSK